VDFSPEQKYNLLTAMGYSGSSKAPEMDAFVQSNPRAAALMGKFTRVVKKRTGMAGVALPLLLLPLRLLLLLPLRLLLLLPLLLCLLEMS
jgi:hypothetical protein